MFVFVILHFLSEDITLKCIDSICARFDMHGCRVIIVDNASPDGSGRRLKTRFKDKDFCDVIINEKNLGFAGGNNAGYCYAKKKYSPDYIIVMNNDVMLTDSMCAAQIVRTEKETRFHILGPNIVSLATGEHQNPIRLEGYEQEEVIEDMQRRKRWLRYYPLHFFYAFVLNNFLSRHRQEKEMPKKNKAPDWEMRTFNPILHGACYILSRRFIDNESFLFHPETFLYFEEAILHYRCMQKDYLMVYDPSVKVLHMEDVSTDMAFKSHYKKRRMKYKYSVQSAQIMLKLMENEAGNNENSDC